MKQSAHCITFRQTCSNEIASQLRDVVSYTVSSDKESIQNFVDTFYLNENDRLILCVGDYSGKDKDKIRIEQICTNKFKNGIIAGSTNSFDISRNIQTSSNSKLAYGIGNSYCNLISYLFCKKLENSSSKPAFVFIHIPKNFETEIAKHEIQTILNTYK